jgi:hypothetical protein
MKKSLYDAECEQLQRALELERNRGTERGTVPKGAVRKRGLLKLNLVACKG